MKGAPIKSKRIAGILLTLGFVVAFLGATQANRPLLVAALVMVVAAAILFFLFWRCPKCGKRLPLQSKDPITQCPECGHKFEN